jgi:hypothetical protein
MKLIVAGGRDFDYFETLSIELDYLRGLLTEEVTIVSGTAKGADSMGEKYAEQEALDVVKFPAYWNKHGRAAGYIRNSEMADYSDILLAFWDGESKGTKHMIDLAIKKGLMVKVVRY